MLQGKGMWRCNGRVGRWYATAINGILRDVAEGAVAGDLMGSVVPCAHGRGHILLLTTKHKITRHCGGRGTCWCNGWCCWGEVAYHCRRRHCKGLRDCSSLCPLERMNHRETKTTQQPTTTITLQGRGMWRFGGREWGERGQLHRKSYLLKIYHFSYTSIIYDIASNTGSTPKPQTEHQYAHP